ncbi:unnamed protein product, partial [Amoebophrya sp. A25]|eukprot:GSA25T00026561001.1
MWRHSFQRFSLANRERYVKIFAPKPVHSQRSSSSCDQMYESLVSSVIFQSSFPSA